MNILYLTGVITVVNDVQSDQVVVKRYYLHCLMLITNINAGKAKYK